MTPEGKVREFLKRRVEELGGEIRAIRYIGRSHCPDVKVMFPPMSRGANLASSTRIDSGLGWQCEVETKAPGKRPRPGQAREHVRLRMCGVDVRVCATIEQVDAEFPLK
jgi:hypothetical protein